MTDRDAAVDRAIEEYGDARVRFADYGDDPNRAALVKQMLDDASAAVRAAVEQAIADAYMQGWRDRFNEPIAKAELERQRGQDAGRHR